MVGMGDMATLIERAQDKIKQSEQESMEKSFMSGRLTLQDFAQQMNMMNKLGNLSQLIKYIPGMNASQISQNELARGEREMKRFRAIIDSMTPKERLNHKILDTSRKLRVAHGAGTEVAEVNLLLERFEQAQQYVKLFKKSGLWNKIR
jgi:signal recognition particle subunit SRP54